MSTAPRTLAATHPDLAAQWHPTRNNTRLVGDVTYGSSRKVWWLCDLGHSWESQVRTRSSGAGCPICANKVVLAGFNDLATTRPDLAAQWHPTRNNDLTAQQVTAGSKREVWWRCRLGHDFKTSPNQRTARGIQCPTCTGHAVLPGFNDLATTHPGLAAQWHPTRNGDLTAQGVTAGSSKSAWWRCPVGHEWAQVVRNRTERDPEGIGCRDCRTARPRPGFRCARPGVNDLATTHPDAVALFHPNRNGDLSVREVPAGARLRLWWQCARGHEWHADRPPSQCPFCLGRRLWRGFNDLATTHPVAAALLHPTRNGDRTARDIIGGPRQSLWWQCPRKHEWQSSQPPQGCPFCEGQRIWPGFNDLATTHPRIAAQWHPTRNDDVRPETVKASSRSVVWWRCGNGHEWQAQPRSRTQSSRSGCPVCG